MFQILVVCTANICRSPAAATLLRRALADVPATVESAGTGAIDGQPACDLSSALVGEFVAREYGGATGRAPDPAGSSAHRSRPVTTEMLTQADLVVALDRSHRAELARLEAAARTRTFTLRQAARLSQVVAGYTAHGQVPPGAPPVPADPEARLRWWVAELDAARGTAMATPEPETRQVPLSWHPDDVPDPHVLGYQIHGESSNLIEEGILSLSSGIVQALAFTAAEDTPRGHVD